MEGPLSQARGFERYCAKVRALPVLTAGEEELLVRRWMKQRDARAAKRLLEGNLRVVLALSGKYRSHGVSREELVAEGNLGLLRALDHFDGRQVRFATYAVHWVRSAMLALVMKSHSLVPSGTSARQARLFFRLRGERSRLEARYGADPQKIEAELSRLFNATPEEIREHTARQAGPDGSLDAPRGEDDETSAVADLMSDEAALDGALESREQASVVQSVLKATWPTLDSRERLLLEKRLMADEEQTLQTLGDEVGLTRERMRQLEAKLKTRLRSALQPVMAA